MSTETSWRQDPRLLFLVPLALVVSVGIGIAQLVINASYLGKSRHDLSTFLASNHALTISINGKSLPSSRSLLNALRNCVSVAAHHTGPLYDMHVVLKGESGSLDLDVGRDDSDPTDYWVFDPKHTWTSYGGSDFCHIRTRALDGF